MRSRTLEHPTPLASGRPYPLPLLAAKAVLVVAGIVMLAVGGVGSLALWRSGHPPVATFDAVILVGLAVAGLGGVAVGCALGRSRGNPPAA